MIRIMLLTPAEDRRMGEELRPRLEELGAQVLFPSPADQDPGPVERVELFVLAASWGGRLERLAQALRRDELLADIPRLVVTEERALADFDYCRLADDILLLPFGRGELEARIRMLTWRNQQADQGGEIQSGELTINLSTYEVAVGGELIDLTFKEYELLRYLVSHRNRVHTRRELLTRVWGEDYYGGPRTVDVHVRRIRAKIETGGKLFIQTVRGVGYRFAG